MADKSQSFDQHAAWQPMFHFFALPLVLIAALHRTWSAVTEPSTMHIAEALLLWAIAIGVFVSRVMVLRVQDRVIRLEMRIRLKEVLPTALAARIPELTPRQLVALRFAGDAELPTLVERTLKGEFETSRDIKRAIKDWQPDHFRA